MLFLRFHYHKLHNKGVGCDRVNLIGFVMYSYFMHTRSINKILFLMTAKLAGALTEASLTKQRLMYAKREPATEIILKEAGE